MRDYMHRIPEAVQELGASLKDGSLICRQHILQGLDSFPDGFEMLLAGANEGKLLIRVDHQNTLSGAQFALMDVRNLSLTACNRLP